jgi:hypothetical protein
MAHMEISWIYVIFKYDQDSIFYLFPTILHMFI